MNIGIDVDGVLTDIQGFNRRHAPRFFKHEFNREVVDESPYDIRDIFKCPDDEYTAYWRKYLLRYATLEPARRGAKKVTRQLRIDGHSIYIISKRVFTCRDDFLGKFMRFLVRNWLWRNGIQHDEIMFCDNDVPDSKRIACEERKIDVMIDDETVNIEAIAPIANVICFDASYNRNCIGNNIKRVHDWYEVLLIVKELNKLQVT
ncbi:MAG: hypothetical protein LBD23_07025 [Oscillospiraceae bacterium]|jgi:uncharacterized HAD superfamily protein|nr:hypothetical protein [Oscillospiraceae bacterium]